MALFETVWQLKNENPLIWNRFLEEHPEVALLCDTFGKEIPEALSLDPFDTGDYVRPLRHLRAFYKRLNHSGVVAFKGTEILNDTVMDKVQMLDQVQVDYPSKGRSLFTVLEHFPIVEQKIPMVVTYNECMEDVDSAMLLQKRHWDFFETFAQAPIPLLVIKWNAKITASYINQLLPMLSARAGEIVTLVAQKGLACIIYYYPELPIRVAHMDLEFKLKKESYPQRLEQLKQQLNPKTVIDLWIDNTAKMLSMGLMPSSIESIGVGHCLEAQNAVLDGGFVDLGSIKPFEKITTEKEFLQTFSATVIDLANTIQAFLLGPQIQATAEYRNPTLTMMNTLGQVQEKLFSKIAIYANQFSVDKRLQELITYKDLFQALDTSYNTLFADKSMQISHNKTGSKGTSIK